MPACASPVLTVILRYILQLEGRKLASSTINFRLVALGN